MTTTIRLPLGQFEFIEQTFNKEMTPNEAVEAFNALQEAYKGGEGMSDKEMDLVIQNMCLNITTVNGTELWGKATLQQRMEINRLKRALNRITAKLNKEPEIYKDSQ